MSAICYSNKYLKRMKRPEEASVAETYLSVPENLNSPATFISMCLFIAFKDQYRNDCTKINLPIYISCL